MAEKWTTDLIPDLSGKIVIVTGANSGLGFEAAKVLAGKRATVVLACRNLQKAAAAQLLIQHKVPNAVTEIIPLDLGNLISVQNFAAIFKKKYKRLDILLNNAGLMAGSYQQTNDGFESHFGTNHLGHFALTGLLLNALHDTPDSRIVTVSSLAHRMGTIDFDNLLYVGGVGYRPMAAYGRSKLANLLFTYELQRKLTRKGSSTIAVAAHPGVAVTHMAPYIKFSKIILPLAKVVLQSPDRGAYAELRAATDPEVKGGTYYGPGGLMGISGYPVVTASAKESYNRDYAGRLWEVSERLSGVCFL
jgi:NAD(P)-dependent dehydrogenase (short-subunit alcohol dehydrogenase family)